MASLDESAIKLRELNGVKVYEVSAARAARSGRNWKSQRKLRKNVEYRDGSSSCRIYFNTSSSRCR